MNNDPANLSSKCHSCHSVKTARQDGSFGFKAGQVQERGSNLDGTPRNQNSHWNKTKGDGR